MLAAWNAFPVPTDGKCDRSLYLAVEFIRMFCIGERRRIRIHVMGAGHEIVGVEGIGLRKIGGPEVVHSNFNGGAKEIQRYVGRLKLYRRCLS